VYKQPGVKVEAIGEPIILRGNVEKLSANFVFCEALDLATNPPRFLAVALSL
jgi:hypothetical protein